MIDDIRKLNYNIHNELLFTLEGSVELVAK